MWMVVHGWAGGGGCPPTHRSTAAHKLHRGRSQDTEKTKQCPGHHSGIADQTRFKKEAGNPPARLAPTISTGPACPQIGRVAEVTGHVRPKCAPPTQASRQWCCNTCFAKTCAGCTTPASSTPTASARLPCCACGCSRPRPRHRRLNRHPGPVCAASAVDRLAHPGEAPATPSGPLRHRHAAIGHAAPGPPGQSGRASLTDGPQKAHKRPIKGPQNVFAAGPIPALALNTGLVH